MSEVFVLPCPCGKNDFVFGRKPRGVVIVKCTECKEEVLYDPTSWEEKEKEVDKIGSTAEQEL